jgi:hypothetical protein
MGRIKAVESDYRSLVTANYIGGAIARSGGKIPPLEKFLPKREEQAAKRAMTPMEVRGVMTQWAFKMAGVKGKPKRPRQSRMHS